MTAETTEGMQSQSVFSGTRRLFSNALVYVDHISIIAAN